MFLALLFKVISLISLIAGSLLVGVTLITVSETGLPQTNVTSVERLNLTENVTATNISGSRVSRRARSIVLVLELPSELDAHNLSRTLSEAKQILENLEPHLRFAAGMALGVGVVQILIAATFVLSTFKKNSCHFSKVWNSHYFILGTLLFTCFILLWSVNESKAEFENDLEKITQILSSITSQGITLDYVKNKYLFYFSITMDATLLYVIGFVTVFCLVNLQ